MTITTNSRRCFIGQITSAMVSLSFFKRFSRPAAIPFPDLWIDVPHAEQNIVPSDIHRESHTIKENNCKLWFLFTPAALQLIILLLIQQAATVAPAHAVPGYEHICPPPQRVPLTGSMLFAYAAMRGNIDKDCHQPDPLHSSLYGNPLKHTNSQFEMPVDLPRWQLENDFHMAQD